MLTDDARHQNVHPALDLTRILKSYRKRNDKKISGKIGLTDTVSDKSRGLIGQKRQNTFE